MFNILKPPLRAFKYKWLQWSAEQKASQIDTENLITVAKKRMAFIIGCGRSGTTILGQLFSHHPQVSYLFEPYHLWATIEPKTDALNLFHQIEPCLLMEALHYNHNAYFQFNHLIRSTGKTKLIMEKTPLNALRIGYLEAIAPGSKFIHIVRDGTDVCHSIDKLASSNLYKITGKPSLNQWWGINYAKWKALKKDGIAAGYYVREVDLLVNNLSKGAYEWLVTLGEIEKWRASLDTRLQEISYHTLITKPKSTLKSICDFLNLDCSLSWLDKAASQISPTRASKKSDLSLPPQMCNTFNYYQQKYAITIDNMTL